MIKVVKLECKMRIVSQFPLQKIKSDIGTLQEQVETMRGKKIPSFNSLWITQLVIKLFDSSLPFPKHKDENASFSSFFSSSFILLLLLPSPSTLALALALGGTFFFRCSKWKGNRVTLLWKFMSLLCWFHSEPSCEALPNGSHLHC